MSAENFGKIPLKNGKNELREHSTKHKAAQSNTGSAQPISFSPEAYREFFDSIADAIGVIAMDGTVREANRAACDLYGYTKEEIIGAPAIYVLTEGCKDKMAEALEAVKQGKTLTVETQNYRKDGSRLTTEVRISPAMFLGEVHMMVVIRDATERTRLRDQVFQSEAHFRQIAENVDEIMWLATMERTPRLIYVNSAFQEIYGYSEKDIYANPQLWLAAVHPDDKERVSLKRSNALFNGEKFDAKFRIVRPNGEICWLHSRAFDIRDDSGQVQRFAGIARDITREVEAEQALKDSEEKRRLALEAAKVGVWEWDFKTNDIIFDPILMSFLGYPEEVSRMSIQEYLHFVHPADLENDIKNIQDHMQGRTPEFETERRMLHKDGSYRTCLVRGHLVLDDAGEPLRFVGTMMDIDNLKRVENSLRSKTQRLQTMRDILAVILKGGALEQTINALLRRLKQLVPYSRASIVLLEEDGKFGRVIAMSLEQDTAVRKHTLIDASQLLVLDKIRHGEIFVAHDLHLEEYTTPIWQEIIHQGIRSLVAAPLSSDQELLGYLNVGSDQVRVFTDEDTEIIGEIADELAVTIRQARMTEEFRKKAVALEALRKGTQDITRRLNLKSVLKSIAENVCKIINAKATTIYILDKGREYAELQVAHGPGPFKIGQRVEMGMCLVGQVWQEQRPMKVDEYCSWADSLPELRPLIKGAVIGVPIMWDNEFRGVVVGSGEEVGAFSQHDLDQLELFASQAAIAIRNAELYEELLENQHRLKRLASEVSLAEEHERRSLASDLHDHVGQSLAMAKNLVAQLHNSDRNGNMDEALGQLNQLLSQSIADIRSLIFEISPPVLYELGFEPAVEWLSEQFQEKHGIEIRYSDDGREKLLDEDICIFLFKAVRELLVNMTKHAQATRASITISRVEDMIVLDIRDNGRGFDMSRIDIANGGAVGFGLFNIRERADYFGGAFDICSGIGEGTSVLLKAPLSNEDSGSFRFGISGTAQNGKIEGSDK